MEWAANDLITDADHVVADRFVFELEAVILHGSDDPIKCVLVNLSRDGFRVWISCLLKVGDPIWLAVTGWPRLMGKVAWSEATMAGFEFTVPVKTETLTTILQSAQGRDRLGDDIII